MPDTRGWVPREQVINKLRSLGYKYDTRGDRAEIWRRKGGTRMISVRIRDLLPPDYVRSTFRQCGLTEPEIETFLGESKA